jgi:hypothetical protein
MGRPPLLVVFATIFSILEDYPNSTGKTTFARQKAKAFFSKLPGIFP